MLLVLKVIPVLVSMILISEVLDITISVFPPPLSTPATARRSSISTPPPNLDMSLLSSEMLPAIPQRGRYAGSTGFRVHQWIVRLPPLRPRPFEPFYWS